MIVEGSLEEVEYQSYYDEVVELLDRQGITDVRLRIALLLYYSRGVVRGTANILKELQTSAVRSDVLERDHQKLMQVVPRIQGLIVSTRRYV